MIFYIINLIIILIITIMSEKIINKRVISKSSAAWIVSIILILISGLRDNVGTDSMTYFQFYKTIPNYEMSIFFNGEYNYITSFEKGFGMIVWAIGKIVINPIFITIIIAAITIIPIIFTIKSYSKYFSFSIFLYITTMCYYSSFNGVRQWVACSILFWGIRYVFNKEFIKYSCIVLLATCIHVSAFIFFIVYFIVNCKPWSKKIIILSLLTIGLVIFLPEIFEIMSKIASGDNQKYFIIKENDAGINIIRILVAAIPVVIGLIFNNKLITKDDNYRVFINFSLLNLIFKILATQKNVINRFSLYFEIYNVFLIPLFLLIFCKKERKLVSAIIMACYLAYMIFLLPSQGNLLPYKTILF